MLSLIISGLARAFQHSLAILDVIFLFVLVFLVSKIEFAFLDNFAIVLIWFTRIFAQVFPSLMLYYLHLSVYKCKSQKSAFW